MNREGLESHLRILWLKTELLHPVDKGGKIRTYHTLKELKRAGHDITYLTLDDTNIEGKSNEHVRAQADEYCTELIVVPHRTRPKFSAGFYVEIAQNLTSRLPYFINKYRSKAMHDAIATCVAKSRYDVVVCDFLMPAVNIPANLKIPVVLFQHNVEAMIWKRHYEVQKHPAKRAFLYGQWRKAFAYEREVCSAVESVIAVSGDDAAQMRRDYGVERIADVPTGVDTEFFRPAIDRKPKPYNLVFTGSMDWLPNEDAMRFFTDEMMPLIKREIPQVTLTIVGRNPYSSLIELSKRDSSVIVTGRVEDVRPYMNDASAYIVPIRIGGGTRLKIYEAMAMNLPMVSTTVGAEGLPVRDGSDLIIADAPQDFAAAVIKLLRDDKEAAQRMADNAARLVREHYSWQNSASIFAELCMQATKRAMSV